MNWGELKKEIRDLGFEEDSAIEEYKDIVISAANRALHMINSTVLPVTSRYDFTQDGTETGIKKYDMIELTRENGKRKFLSFVDTPVRMNGGIYGLFNDFDIEEGHIVVMDGGLKGEFSIFYRKLPERIVSNMSDNVVLDINERVAPLLPLLTAHYVWLDDDERKATQYYNEYDALKEELAGDNARLRGKIRGGF